MLIEQYSEIREFAFLPMRALDSYRAVSGDKGSTQYELRQMINREYQKAASEENGARVIYKKGNMVVEDLSLADRVCIITGIPSAKDKSSVVLLFVPNRNQNQQPWEMTGAVSEDEFNSDIYVDIGNKPKELLLNYAHWTNYLNDLKVLKNQLALHENWSFKEAPDDDDFPILKIILIIHSPKPGRTSVLC